MDDKIKYLLLAVGAYFLYDWYKGQVVVQSKDYSKMSAMDLDAAFKDTRTSATDRAIITNLLSAMADAGNDVAAALLGRPVTTYPTESAATTSTPPTPASAPVWASPVYTPVTVSPSDAAVLAAMDSDTIARAAVLGDEKALAESERRGLKFNFHQWNYYLALTRGAQPDPSTFYGGDPNDVVTAPMYLLTRATALATGAVQGLTGLGWAPRLPWSTAWEA